MNIAQFSNDNGNFTVYNGSNISGRLASGVLTGTVTSIGIHKGQTCFDIRLADGSERFVYARQVFNVEYPIRDEANS